MSTFIKLKQHIANLLKKELSPNLHYHGWYHTMEVYANAIEIAKALKINRDGLRLIKVAVLFHDAGFIKKYEGHEEEGCKMAKKTLPEYGFSNAEIKLICGMILATKIPQSPKTVLEQIISDADLMYLGTDRFESTGLNLFHERNIYFGIIDDIEWYKFQIKFLTAHHFHTSYCIKNYEPMKQKNLKSLKLKIK